MFPSSFETSVLPFGPHNVPGTFQRIVFPYLSNNEFDFEQHLARLKMFVLIVNWE